MSGSDPFADLLRPDDYAVVRSTFQSGRTMLVVLPLALSERDVQEARRQLESAIASLSDDDGVTTSRGTSGRGMN
jgi:hypothetical protein